jgi:stage II sporulation protein D
MTLSRQSRPAPALALALAVPVVLVATGSLAPAMAAADRSSSAATHALPVPSDGTLTLDGRGYGHGHGLSQYGAEGAARMGLTANKIVKFYYPHTKRGTSQGRVKVLITADTDDNTTVLAEPGLTVRDLAGKQSWTLPTTGTIGRATRWRLAAAPGGASRLDYRTDGWHTWKHLTGDGEFGGPSVLTLVLAGNAQVDYRGTLQLRRPATGGKHRVTVNKVPLDAYVKAVVPREMPALWHAAALKAQAIAARTYAAYEVAHSTNRLYQLCDTSQCQVYGGESAEYPTTNQAVQETAHQILTYQGEPAFTQFNASDGGWTADGGEPYLPAQPDPYDGWSGNAVGTWTTTVPVATIEKKWPALGTLTSITVDSRDDNGEWGGRVTSMTLGGSQQDLVVTGDAFRTTLGLRSTWFDIAATT